MDKTQYLTSRSSQSKEEEKHGKTTTQDTKDCDRSEGGMQWEHEREICSPMWRGDAVRKDLPLQETAELVWRMRKLTCKRMGRAIPGRKQNDTFEGLPAIH